MLPPDASGRAARSQHPHSQVSDGMVQTPISVNTAGMVMSTSGMPQSGVQPGVQQVMHPMIVQTMHNGMVYTMNPQPTFHSYVPGSTVAATPSVAGSSEASARQEQVSFRQAHPAIAVAQPASADQPPEVPSSKRQTTVAVTEKTGNMTETDEEYRDDSDFDASEIEEYTTARVIPETLSRSRAEETRRAIEADPKKIAKYSNVVFDLADRDTKSERFNKMKPGDRVIITHNHRSGHHDVTGKKQHLINKFAIVLLTAQWPNTWLTVRIEETDEEVKVRTSNIMMADDVKEYKDLITLKNEQQEKLHKKAVALRANQAPVEEGADYTTESQMQIDSPYSTRFKGPQVRQSFDEGDHTASDSVAESSRARRTSTHKRKGPQLTDPEELRMIKRPTIDGGYVCEVANCGFMSTESSDGLIHRKLYHSTALGLPDNDTDTWIPNVDNLDRSVGSSIVTSASYRLDYRDTLHDVKFKQSIREDMYATGEAVDGGAARTAEVLSSRKLFDSRRAVVHSNKSHKSTAPIYCCPVTTCKERFKEMSARGEHVRRHPPMSLRRTTQGDDSVEFGQSNRTPVQEDPTDHLQMIVEPPSPAQYAGISRSRPTVVHGIPMVTATASGQLVPVMLSSTPEADSSLENNTSN